MIFEIDGKDYTVKFTHNDETVFRGHDTVSLKEATWCLLREYDGKKKDGVPFKDGIARIVRYVHDLPNKTLAHKKALSRAMDNLGAEPELRKKLWDAYFNRRKDPKEYK